MYNTSDDLICLLIVLGLMCFVLGASGWMLDKFPRIDKVLEQMFEKLNDIINALFFPEQPEPIQPKYPQSSWRTDPDGKITLLSVQWGPEPDKRKTASRRQSERRKRK